MLAETKSLRLRRNLTALIDFSRIINSSIDLDFILNNVLLTCLGKFLATKGLIALNEKGMMVPKHYKGLNDSAVKDFPELISSEECINSPAIISFMNKAHLIAIERISSSDDCIGIVCLGEKLNKTEYTADDLEFLKTILNISATAIQNSMFFNELKKVNRKLDSRIQRLNSLFELSKEFGLFQESNKVARLLVYSVIGQFLISRYAVILFNDNGTELLESKFDKEKLLEKINNSDLKEIDDSLTFEMISNAYPGLMEIGIELIVPMQLQGKTKGLILLGNRVNRHKYQDADIEFIYSVGNLAIISLENKRLFNEALEKQKLEEELMIARDIQQNLLPQSIPLYKGFDISALNVSSKQVGGDYYDIIPLDKENFCIAIADVAGKGVPASLLMANIQAFLQVISKQGILPQSKTTLTENISEATGLINNLITENTSDGSFITFFWGVVNTKQNTLTYVNAGHNPPLLLRRGKIIKLEKGGMVLGVMKTEIPYIFEEIKINKNDVLIMFTDGVSEAMSLNEEEFSEERLQKIGLSLTEKTSSEIMDGITNEVQEFTSGNQQSDDITMIVMKVV